MDKRPLKVFLCHASTDKPKVRELYRYLKRRGINPWFDEEHLVGGQDWQVEIPKAIATSDAIIICLTKNSIDREGYIQKEIKFALDKALEMPEGRIFLIPVKFEECEVPFTLSRYQWVDLTVESGYAKMMKALKFRASQLERSTVEVSKKDVEEENLVREKAEKEATEKARLEAEELARQKAAKDKAERQATERAERERKEKEFREKQAREAREKARRETEKKEEKPATIKLKGGGQIVYWIGGFIVLALGIILLLSLNNPSSAELPTPEITQTQANAALPQNTVEPSVTTAPKLTSTPVFALTPASLPTEITDAKGVSMVLVPAGAFIMGSDDEEVWNAAPAHTVYLEAFYIDKYEVTIALYKACIGAGYCKPPPDENYYYENGSSVNEQYPAGYIHWDMAVTFCNWRGARLPTEAEWEKAARGTDGRTYPWGEGEDCSKANLYLGWDNETQLDNFCLGDYDDRLLEIGSYEYGKSIYGVYDMFGNVAEWVSSLAYAYPYLHDGRENLLIPGVRASRGSYFHGIIHRDLTQFDAMKNYPWGLDDQGFRCARDATP